MGLNDVPKAWRGKLQQRLRARVEAGEFEVIFFEGELPAWLRPALARRYLVKERRQGEQRVLPLTGFRSKAGMVKPFRGDQLWLRRPEDDRSSAPRDGKVLADFEDGTLQGFERRGRAFTGGPVRSIHGRVPGIAGAHGEYLVASLAGRGDQKARGELWSPPFDLPTAGGEIEFKLGSGGDAEGLSVWLVDAAKERPGREPMQIEIATPKRAWSLSEQRWLIPEAWRGRMYGCVSSMTAREAPSFSMNYACGPLRNNAFSRANTGLSFRSLRIQRGKWEEPKLRGDDVVLLIKVGPHTAR